MNGVMNTSNTQVATSNTSTTINSENHKGRYNEGNKIGGSILNVQGGVINRPGAVLCMGPSCPTSLQNLDVFDFMDMQNEYNRGKKDFL